MQCRATYFALHLSLLHELTEIFPLLITMRTSFSEEKKNEVNWGTGTNGQWTYKSSSKETYLEKKAVLY